MIFDGGVKDLFPRNVVDANLSGVLPDLEAFSVDLDTFVNDLWPSCSARQSRYNEFTEFCQTYAGYFMLFQHVQLSRGWLGQVVDAL